MSLREGKRLEFRQAAITAPPQRLLRRRRSFMRWRRGKSRRLAIAIRRSMRRAVIACRGCTHMGEIVSYSVVDGVAVVTIDNPPVNAMDRGVRAGLQKAFSDLKGRPDVKAIVLGCA